MAERLAWFHCFSGIAGDMATGALIDAGAPVEEVRELVDRVPLDGWELSTEPVLRAGIAATSARVGVTTSTVVRTAAHIQGLLTEARLPDRVRDRALATFAALAEAEGQLHRRPPEQVHFHEVGSTDAIVDVVGVCAALEILGIDRVTASPVATGVGMVRSAHGTLPNPAPAVVELLRGAPTRGIDTPVELTTPTGAALLAAMSTEWGPMPEMTITASGFGAGDRDIQGRPNVTQVVVGETTAAGTAEGSGNGVGGQPVLHLEVNLDDVTGEVLAHAVDAALGAGAHDAWITPVVMKKGRPAHILSALVDVAVADQVAAVLRAETGSPGIRSSELTRWAAPRSRDTVTVEGTPLRVKLSPGRAKVEADDAARAARHLGMPLREVTRRAEQAWWASGGDRNHGGGDQGPTGDDELPPDGGQAS